MDGGGAGKGPAPWGPAARLSRTAGHLAPPQHANPQILESQGVASGNQSTIKPPMGGMLPLRLNSGGHGNGNEFGAADEYCHYSPSSIAALSSDDAFNAYDRWFLNGYNQEGTMFFAAAFGENSTPAALRLKLRPEHVNLFCLRNRHVPW